MSTDTKCCCGHPWSQHKRSNPWPCEVKRHLPSESCGCRGFKNEALAWTNEVAAAQREKERKR